jgi:hypothetical protein
MLQLQYDDQTRANMEAALQSACKDLPKALDDHASRRFIAERILDEVEAGRTALSGLQVTARLALIALRRKSMG